MAVSSTSFVKGDPRINRKGRPLNADKDLLRKALEDEGKRRGEDFWVKVAKAAFDDKGLMAAICKKFVPDMSSTEHSGEISHVTEMPTVQVCGQDLEIDIGSNPEPASDSGPTPEVTSILDGDQQLPPVSG